MTTQITLPEDFGRDFVLGVRRALDSAAEALGELDRRAGDGDFGTSVRTALGMLDREVQRTDPQTYREWLTALYRGWLGVGGTSGPLLGVFFRELSLAGEQQAPPLAEFARALGAGQDAVQRYGEAEVGDKTMIDALDPAVRALRRAVDDGQGTVEALETAERAAVDGAQATAGTTARRGRASYVGEAAKDVIDPGAAAMALVIAAALGAAQGSQDIDDTWIR